MQVSDETCISRGVSVPFALSRKSNLGTLKIV